MTDTIYIEFKRLPHANKLDLPQQLSAQAAGLDLPAAIDSPIIVLPMQRVLIPTGFAIALPDGFEAQVRPRSGLALKHGITVLNSPGTIDADYRGEIKVILINLGDMPFEITYGMRIAQMVIAPVCAVKCTEVQILTETKRGNSGFGSTGTTL